MRPDDHQDHAGPVQPIRPHWAQLIRKLRWIGLENEAEHLEFAVRTVPPDRRMPVSPRHFDPD